MGSQKRLKRIAKRMSRPTIHIDLTRIEAYRAKVRKLKLTLFLYLVLFAIFSSIAYRIHLGLLKLRRLSCEIIVYGGGPVAWTTASSLLEKGYDVLLYTPANYVMTTLFLKGSTEAISIPSSLAFHTSPIRLTMSTPEEKARLSKHLSLPLSKIEEVEKKLWNQCQKLVSDTTVNELLSNSELQKDSICMVDPNKTYSSYNFSWQSLFFPKARTYYTSLLSTEEQEEGVRCSFANGFIECGTLIIAEEFPHLALKNNTQFIPLAGPVGFSLKQPIDKKAPFAQTLVLSKENIYVDIASDGHEMTINVFSILPYTSLPTLSFKCRSRLTSRLREILGSIGADDVIDTLSISPISRSPFGPLPGRDPHEPKESREASVEEEESQRDRRDRRESHIVYLNSLSVLGSSDTLRDTLLLAMRSDILLPV